MGKYKPDVQGLRPVSLKLDPAVWLRTKIYSLQSGDSPSEVVQKALVAFLDSLDSTYRTINMGEEKQEKAASEK